MVRLWDLRARRCVAVLAGHGGWVTSVAFGPGGKVLASASSDGTVKLWSVKSKECLWSLGQRSTRVRCVALSPNGKFLACAGDDGVVELWNVARIGNN